MTSGLVIVGVGGHATSVTNIALSIGINVVAYIDDNNAGTFFMGHPVISMQQCVQSCLGFSFAIGIGDNSVRERVFKEFQSKNAMVRFPRLIHPSSVIGIGSKIGEGTVIMPLANVGPNSEVGTCCILNTGSSIDHDCHMRDFSSIAPRAVCGGSVRVGLRSAISIGAVVKHGISIGDDVVVGGNSYVNESIKNNVLAFGSPCKNIRPRSYGDPYLS